MKGTPLTVESTPESDLQSRPARRYALRFGTHQIPLKARVTTAGRSTGADIPLLSALASRRHATFSVDEAGVTVVDHGSRNGVFVNGERITAPRELEPRDVIVIGDDSLTLIELDGVAERRAETTSEMRPVQPEATPHPPSFADEDVTVAMRRADAFQLLSGVVDKALALGRGEEAEHLLGTHLASAMADASSGRSIPPEIARTTARYALKLAAATNKPGWLDFPVRLYRALGATMPLPIVDELYTLIGRVRGMNRPLLREYLESLRARAESMSPTERFVLQRLEGLERMASLQSDSP